MDGKTKKKESPEFARFQELTRKLVGVPKKEIEKQEKKYRQEQTKKKAG